MYVEGNADRGDFASLWSVLGLKISCYYIVDSQ